MKKQYTIKINQRGCFPKMSDEFQKYLYQEFWVQGEEGLKELIEIGKDFKFRKEGVRYGNR